MAIKSQLSFYTSRATRAHFTQMLSNLGGSGLSGSSARKLLQECFADASMEDLHQSNRSATVERLAKAIGEGGKDIILDLRALNFRVDDPRFDKFWDWVAGQFADNDNTAVDSRRGDGLRLCPMAKFSSAPELLRVAKKELGDDVELPSLRWLYFQFFPTNPHSHVSNKHTGRLEIKLKMQACILRAHHVDKAYCWKMWGMLREFVLVNRDFTSLQSSDDKKSIPVGNTGNLVCGSSQ